MFGNRRVTSMLFQRNTSDAFDWKFNFKRGRLKQDAMIASKFAEKFPLTTTEECAW